MTIFKIKDKEHLVVVLAENVVHARKLAADYLDQQGWPSAWVSAAEVLTYGVVTPVVVGVALL